MNIVNSIHKRILRRKLDNGLIEVKEFFENGQLWTHYFLDKDGSYQGKLDHWYDNGQIHEIINYKDDKMHGVYKCWRKNGELLSHELWNNDTIIKDYIFEKNYKEDN